MKNFLCLFVICAGLVAIGEVFFSGSQPSPTEKHGLVRPLSEPKCQSKPVNPKPPRASTDPLAIEDGGFPGLAQNIEDDRQRRSQMMAEATRQEAEAKAKIEEAARQKAQREAEEVARKKAIKWVDDRARERAKAKLKQAAPAQVQEETEQAARNKLIQKLVAANIFQRVEFGRLDATIWVGPVFYSLDFEDKEVFCSVVHKYVAVHTGQDLSTVKDSIIVMLRDFRSGKTVGDYCEHWMGFGLQMK